MLSEKIFKELEGFLNSHEILWEEADSQNEKSQKFPLANVNAKPTGGMIVRPMGGMAARPLNGSILSKSESSGDASLDAFLKNKKIFANILKNAKDDFDKKKKRVHENSEIYNKVCMSKQVFSKIFNHKLPAKDSVIKFAFALEATLQEAEDLLRHSGYSLGDCIRRDLIFTFCFQKRIFAIPDVNELLENKNESILGKDRRKETMKLTSLE